MATRGRKYSAAAPAEVRAEVAAQKRQEAAEPTVPERHAWRMDLLRQAGSGMLQNPDHSWWPVALWMTKGIRASEAAYFHSGKEESPVLPGGELDWCCRVAQAYLRRHPPGDEDFRDSEACPDEFAADDERISRAIARKKRKTEG